MGEASHEGVMEALGALAALCVPVAMVVLVINYFKNDLVPYSIDSQSNVILGI